MNHFSNLFSYKYLNYIPYRNKYRYYKLQHMLELKSFDFKFSCQTSKILKKSDLFKIIKKYRLEKYFVIVCKHYYFYKFGPSLNGICTRSVKLLKKHYSNKKPKKRCCDYLLLLTRDEWELPAYKKPSKR